jgi:hypothetical protein
VPVRRHALRRRLGHQRVDIDTAAALAKASDRGRAHGCEAVAGTRIELHGVDLPDLGNRVEELCLGFRWTVLFNGKPLKRRLAEGTWPRWPARSVRCTSRARATASTATNTMVFLQGFCVMKPNYCQRDEVNVVHLDSRQFMARLPDRDKLIDEDVQRKRIDTELKACWRQTLEIAKTQLPPERFVEPITRRCAAGGMWTC